MKTQSLLTKSHKNWTLTSCQLYDSTTIYAMGRKFKRNLRRKPTTTQSELAVCCKKNNAKSDTST